MNRWLGNASAEAAARRPAVTRSPARPSGYRRNRRVYAYPMRVDPCVQPNELKVAAHQFQPAVRSELFVTELDRKLSLDRPPQPPYLQPHLWGLWCRLRCVG